VVLEEADDLGIERLTVVGGRRAMIGAGGFVVFDDDGGNPSGLVSLGEDGVHVGASEGPTLGVASVSELADESSQEVLFQRYDDEGVAVGDELSLGPAPTSPALIGGGSGTSLVGWGYIGDEELGEKSGLLMNGVGPDGALTGPGFAIEEETFSNTLIGSVVPTGSSFAVLWSGDQGAGFLTSFAKVSTQGALGAVTNVISSAPVHKMRRMVKTQAGFAVLFQGGIPADAVYVVLLDEDGIVVPPAHRYLGAKYALDLAVQGDEIGLLAVQQDDRPAFRPLGADGAVQGPWVCLTEPQFGAQAALDADGAGYAMVYRTPGGAVELLKTDSLGSGAP